MWPELPGFVPFSRATLLLDVVAIAMIVVVPVLAWSIRQVKAHRNYALHGRVQLVLGIVLLAAVLLFEIDMRMHGWRHLAKASRFHDTLLNPVLYVHLFFAVSTFFLWIWTIVGALRKFPRPPVPGGYSPRHKLVGKLAAIGMFCTAVTGWTFYVVAFVC